ncbi:MAG TPA: outer membrane beta-barrel protein [Terriglobus sp.]
MKNVYPAVAVLLPLLCVPAAAQNSPQTPGREQEIQELRQELKRIADRLDVLEKQQAEVSSVGNGVPATSVSPAVQASTVAREQAPALKPEDATTLSFLRGTTLNFGFDGYYGYNFNQPIGRVNLLRVYDVSSNSFSINQASIMVEHLPTAAERFGGRIDLQFGQATETLQGSSANEQRPQVYRNLFQAYGSYLAPIGSGLQIDFGKFASPLGNEGNYTKDQIAYSRSFSFNYLPYYHMGVRANYNLTPKVNFTYWLVNGANQTEDFNGFKSQGFIWNFKPISTLSWNVNYYYGQEQRDVEPTLNPGAPTLPTQPGLPTTNITPVPNGREHIFDTYATWSATKNLTVVGEADYVLHRTMSQSQPARVVIGAAYAKYALPKNWNVAGRFEYFDDRGGLFSGKTQALKEFTLVADHVFTPGFLARAEYRRDFSNQKFFLSGQPGVLRYAQPTATLGLVYWWGTKQGAW